MLRLSRLTDYAVVVLVRLSADRSVQTATALAAATAIPEPTVAKVLKLLASTGLVTSRRGSHGGYVLARPLSQIGIAEVITAIDGPIALTACVEGSGQECGTGRFCPVRGRGDKVNDAIHNALAAITLDGMQEHDFFPLPAAPAAAAAAE
jgi:FeS assembly SUF system regulator